MAEPFLPYGEHQIVHFRYVDGMTISEIASLTNYSQQHIKDILKSVREQSREAPELIRERRSMWQARLEHIYARLKKNLDLEGIRYDYWLDTVKTVLATAALSSRIDEQMERSLAAGPHNNAWLSTDVETLSDQQILDIAQKQGIRIPQIGVSHEVRDCPTRPALGPVATPSDGVVVSGP